MAILDARLSKLDFMMTSPYMVVFDSFLPPDSDTAMDWQTVGLPLTSPGFPGARYVLAAEGTGFTYDGTGLPTGGDLFSLTFDLATDDVISLNPGIDAVYTSTTARSLAALFPQTGTAEVKAQAFWSTLLSGNDTIYAPETGVDFAMTGDSFAVTYFTQIGGVTGGNDRMFSNNAVFSSAVLSSRGSSFSGLVGDCFTVSGAVFGDFLFSGILNGGRDTITLTGYAGYEAVGDVVTAGDYASVIGGNDVMTNNTSAGLLPPTGLSRGTVMSGDVVDISAEAYVEGGADHMTGTNYAFYLDRMNGDSENSSGYLIGGNDTMDGRAGQDLISGDVNQYRGGHFEGGRDTINGGDDSDVIAGDMYTTSTLRGIGQILPTRTLLDFTGGNDSISGGEGNDVIAGDILAAWLEGGSSVINGDDRIFGDNGDDSIYGDTIQNDVGVLTLPNTIVGGNDRIDGGAGDDYINGQTGIDTAAYDSLALAVTADLLLGTATGQGSDTLVEIENLVGSTQADILRGNNDANRIDGNDGSDSLIGRAGADSLLGGSGADELQGGRDADLMTGGTGADLFIFTAIQDSTLLASDRILDFSDGTATTAVDRIDLSAIDAIFGGGNNVFDYIGSAAFTGLGEVRVYQSGPNTIIEVNTRSSLDADMRIVLRGLLDVGAEDFVL